MAIVVTPDLTLIHACDAAAWSGGELDTDMKVQGTGCLGDFVDNELGTLRTYTLAGSTDMSNGEHLYVWMQCFGIVNTQALGGYRIYAEDSSANNATWYAGGNDTHGTGWQLIIADLNATPDIANGTLDTSDITVVGIQFYTITDAPVQGANEFNNCYWDVMRYGTGLTITSGASDGITFEDIYAVDNHSDYKYGVVTYKDGTYFINGTLTFGDASGTGNIDFDDSSQIVLFVDSDYYAVDFNNIIVVGNGTGVTNFVMGDKVGGQGVSGCTLKAVDDGTAFAFTATDTDIDVLTIYGTTFFNAGIISLPVTASNREFITCTFESCEHVLPSTCIMQYCTFVSADDEGAIITNTSHNLSDSTLISSPACTEITISGTFTFDNMLFYGSNGSTLYDLENISGGLVTINATNGTNINSSYVLNSGSSTTVINNAVNITLVVKDADNIAIENAQVAVYTTSGSTVLMNEDTTALGVATETYNYSAETDIYYRVRKSSAGFTRYIPVRGVGTIDSGGFTATVIMYEDINIQ